jgi:hypothetical protein
VTVICSRAVDLPREIGFKHFDSVIARSVGPLTNLVQWSFPLLQHDGNRCQAPSPQGGRRALPGRTILALKGGDVSSEIEDMRRHFPEAHCSIAPLAFPGLDKLQNPDKKIIEIS